VADYMIVLGRVWSTLPTCNHAVCYWEGTVSAL